MNTPAHLIFGVAAFGTPGQPRVIAAAAAGALLPDLSLYLLVGWSMLVMNIPAEVVFREMYYSDLWQGIFAIDNSFVLWGALLGAALWRRWPVLIAFAGAGLLHLVFDFLLHNEDARRQFWPLTDWVFVSPVSYWDSSRYGGIIGPLELAVSLALCGWMLWRFKSAAMRGAVALMALAEAASANIWRFIF
ncbi:cobalamin biosynthesis protein CobQ [Anianabacter salinae]|uniref:cobalamin biosynthesis protein CobQ n=1 Tax=Anianabacter salinae TaxID=2851023 RepID=UPI00225DE788|nr:cobalamin biosynthesis protein CobQ [Anianabacter salinae]MBV0912685.1 cobalamin biosynthesis protein CobQ [Anianabacter salinae]